MSKWETVIGLETHAQLSTASKIFSGASTAFGADPNTQASAIDLALRTLARGQPRQSKPRMPLEPRHELLPDHARGAQYADFNPVHAVFCLLPSAFCLGSARNKKTRLRRGRSGWLSTEL